MDYLITKKEFLRLVVEIDELKKIEDRYSEFNIFEALGMVRQEIKHSNAIATIFDSNFGLGLESVFRQFVRAAYKISEVESHFISQFDFELADYNDLEVLREFKNIDLIIISQSNKHVFVIENKVDAMESDGQLNKYQKDIEAEYPGYKKLYLFLSPEDKGLQASVDAWKQIYYEDLVNSIVDYLNRNKSYDEDKRLFLTHYIDLLRRHIMTDFELEKLAMTFYRKHKKALDFIYEIKPDDIKELSDALISGLESQEWFKEGYGFDHSTKGLVRFYKKEWIEIPKYELLNTGDGWTNTGRILLWEVQIREKSGVIILLVLGPSTNLDFRNLLRDNLVSYFSKNKKSNSNKFTRIYSSKKLLNKVDHEAIENIETSIELILKSIKEIVLDKKFNDFIEGSYSKSKL